MYRIDTPLKEWIESGVAVIVATGDASGRPQVRFGWGPRVHDDGSTIEVFIDAQRAKHTLENLQDNGRLAMTIADPVSYRSAQFKGTFRGSTEASSADHEWVQKHREEFLVTTALVGDPPESIRHMWLDEIVGVTFVVEQAFDQTPGPEAGKPL